MQGKHTTIQSFKKEYGLETKDWWKVKAIGGCSTDEVPGVAPRVGEGTAVKYVRGELPKHHKTYIGIVSKEGKENRKRNIRLTRLPYPGTKTFELSSDKLSDKKWDRFCDKLGFESLRGKSARKPRKNFGVKN